MPPEGGAQGAMRPRAALGSGAVSRCPSGVSEQIQAPLGVTMSEPLGDSGRLAMRAAHATADRASAPICVSAGLATVVCRALG